MDCTDRVSILRFEQGALKEFEDIVLSEKSFSLFLNGNLFTKFTCTNKDIKELTAGHLLCEHCVDLKKELKSILIDENSGNVYAETKKEIININHGVSRSKSHLINPDYSSIISALKEFQKMSPLFRETGGVHSAALLDPEYNFRYFAEDMGRYNAVEKVIGKAFLAGFCLSKAILVTSSRMPLELIQKAHSAGITVVVSISAPTLQSIQFARENKMTLAGMFRDNRVNVYSHE